jgi:cell division ATPase MinD
MSRIICVASGKGGVGKTTLCANLAAALAKFGQSVITVDCNITTSNLGLHLGVPLYPVTLQDVLKNRAKLRDAIYYHSAGFRVLPADMSVANSSSSNASKFLDVFNGLAHNGSADIIIVDTAAGLGREALNVIEASDELLTVTNPEMPALIDALKLGRVAEKFGTKPIGMVLNRVKNDPHEVKGAAAEDFLGLPTLGVVNEDRRVKQAISKKEPVVTHSPHSRPARQFKAVAASLIGERYEVRESPIHRLFSWL